MTDISSSANSLSNIYKYFNALYANLAMQSQQQQQQQQQLQQDLQQVTSLPVLNVTRNEDYETLLRLIHLSHDKLTNTTSQILSSSSSSKNKPNLNNTNGLSVYREPNLRRNLLVSKMLHKAKCVYYQSIVQQMRLGLMAKLNYYSTLLQQYQQLNHEADENNEAIHQRRSIRLAEEMRSLMQQILAETYQFNLAAHTYNLQNNQQQSIINQATVKDPNNNSAQEIDLNNSNSNNKRELNNDNCENKTTKMESKTQKPPKKQRVVNNNKNIFFCGSILNDDTNKSSSIKDNSTTTTTQKPFFRIKKRVKTNLSEKKTSNRITTHVAS
jgi:hypothetical protein